MTWSEESRLDRAEPRRGDQKWLAQQWGNPAARLIPVAADGRLRVDGERPWSRATAGEFDDQRHWLLGLVDSVPYFTGIAELPDGQTLRDCGAALDDAGRELATMAVALVNWHQGSPRCAVCGGNCEVRQGGLVRRCQDCGRDRFPRSDAAIIVAVIDPDDRLLLGRQAAWPTGRRSLLAGFVTAGESLEQAVRREVAEESGVRLGPVRYLSSQPWPFPRSLMLGFSARATTAEIRVDEVEIAEAAWFTRAELDRQLASGETSLPMTSSIARGIIERWRAGALPVPEQ